MARTRMIREEKSIASPDPLRQAIAEAMELFIDAFREYEKGNIGYSKVKEAFAKLEDAYAALDPQAERY